MNKKLIWELAILIGFCFVSALVKYIKKKKTKKESRLDYPNFPQVVIIDKREDRGKYLIIFRSIRNDSHTDTARQLSEELASVSREEFDELYEGQHVWVSPRSIIRNAGGEIAVEYAISYQKIDLNTFSRLLSNLREPQTMVPKA